MTDDMIKAIAAKGGVIMINYSTGFLDETLFQENQKRQGLSAEERAKLPPPPRVSWEKIIEHIDHAVKLVGATHVGLGSDFDGTSVPDGMEDCSKLPKITEALLRKGYSETDVKNILGGNILRLMEKVDQTGRDIRSARAVSH
jgi:membrane dipeptidase